MSASDIDLPRVTPRPPQFQTLTVLATVLLALTVLWAFVDPRLLDGEGVWLKPFKFALSFVVFFATLAWVERMLSQPVRDGWGLRIIGWILAAAFLSEMAYIMYQAGRAEPSHFNFSTPFNRLMYEVVMAAGAVALVAGVAAIGWIARKDSAAQIGPAVRRGIWLGFVLTFVLTMITAFTLSILGGPLIGAEDGGSSLPIFGWSGSAGDLRPAHFLALHTMQVVPLMALVLERRGGARAVSIGAAGYAALTLGAYALALMGQPLIPV